MKTLATILGSALALTSTMGLTAFADTPVLEIQSGASTFWVSNFVPESNVPSNTEYQLSSNMVETLPNGQQFTILAADTFINTDPTVSYGVGVTNTSSSFTPYTFTFTTPVAIAAGAFNYSASVAGSITDGGNDGATILTPAGGGAIQTAFIASSTQSSTVVGLLNSTITAPDSAFSDPIPTASASGTGNVAFNATEIGITTAFQLSAGDSATFSGRLDVEAAPEPNSFALGGLCALLFGALALRSRSKA